MTSEMVARALRRMAHEIIEKNKNLNDLVLIGIKRKGPPLAHRVAGYIEQIEGIKPPTGALDITWHRDDLKEGKCEPVEGERVIDVPIEGSSIVLVDDVLYTGRTVRAAMDALMDYGRPKVIQLAVLIDRGHREIPIKADFVGKNVPTSRNEIISVKISEINGVDEVQIME
ncbi:MAG: bifunctional pyr operon transcriptional regulator/uracil phosphoribosyltransferase PyrR [Clostridia bacterium]|nr:bifunctional pyr operon transcriptional regulator/uracil phosphoribosyltransferase PyrR [Clostridia bacterium]